MPRAFNSLSSRNKFAKRHYEAIALAMQEAKRSAGGSTVALSEWIIVRSSLADMLASENGQFNRGRFIAACEPGANVRARNGGSR
jgi:hypothetical protein